jgi:hypothetical protein
MSASRHGSISVVWVNVPKGAGFQGRTIFFELRSVRPNGRNFTDFHNGLVLRVSDYTAMRSLLFTGGAIGFLVWDLRLNHAGYTLMYANVAREWGEALWGLLP